MAPLPPSKLGLRESVETNSHLKKPQAFEKIWKQIECPKSLTRMAPTNATDTRGLETTGKSYPIAL